MGKRGPKPKGKVTLEWSSNFAYAVGLIVSDGNLSPDGRHINFTSKEKELTELYQSALAIKASVTMKRRGDGEEKKYFAVQFSDVLFYNFLLSIGLTPRKSKTIKRILVPQEFFFDFLRGIFDGDGSTYSYYDKRWKSSFMFYTIFASASCNFIFWLQTQIANELGIFGHVTKSRNRTVLQLKYAKRESLILLRRMYKNKKLNSLSRKRLKIEVILSIIGESL